MIGTECVYCKEPLEAGDLVLPVNMVIDGVAEQRLEHRNCGLRRMIGSVAHVQKRCSCYIEGATETDPPELTKRQAADLAVELWEALPEVEK